MNEESLFAAALERATAAERLAFLEAACAGDRALRQRVEKLLAADQQTIGILDQTARPLGGTEFDSGAPCGGARAGERAGTQIDGRYRLIEEIGDGGMGTVWKAEQTQPVRRIVALKLIKPGMDTRTVLLRFEAERQALALMEHPNIAKVLDGGTTESGRPFFVMEYVQGVPFTRHCDDARLSIAERLALFVPVCQAVQHAHTKGIVHRDLKPSNILVGVYDGQPVPKVIDFGLAKALHVPLTEQTLRTAQGVLMGTPLYISPEQADLNHSDVDTRTDIYALGVILFELLTGTTPLEMGRFHRVAWHEVLRLIQEEEPPRPSARLGESDALPSLAAQRQVEPVRLTRLVRGELDWIVMKCLEKAPARRYETAIGLGRDIRRYLEGDPVEAGPPSAAYRLRKIAHKHRAMLGTAAGFAAVLMAATAMSAWHAIRATRAEAKARQDRDAAVAARAAEAKARKRAEAAEEDSRTEADKALAINAFLTEDLLSQTEPERNAAESQVTLREVLDRAAAGVEERFRGQPAVEAAVRRTIAGTYHGLGVFDRSEQHWRALAELERRRTGPDSAEAWTAMAHAGHALDHLGRYGEALELLSQARHALSRLRGPDHPDTLDIMDYLTGAHRDAGQLPEAVSLAEDVFRLRKARLGPDHPDTLIAMNNLAGVYDNAGRHGEALPLLEAAVALLKSQKGPGHPHTLVAMNNLAGSYVSNGRLSVAIPLFEEVFQLNKGKLGPDHPHTFAALSNLATVYRAAGRLDEALPLFQQALAIVKARHGPDHPDTLIAMRNLSVIYRETRRPGEALALAREVLGLMKARHGPDHPDTLVALHNLAMTSQDANRTEEATPLFEEVVRLRKRKLGPDHPFTLLSTDGLVKAYLRARRWAEAGAVARECLEARTRKQPDDWSRFHTMSLLGVALAGQKNYAAAEPLLIEGYQGLRARAAQLPAPSRGLLTAAAARIVPFYEAWGKPAKAAEWRKTLDQNAAEPKT